MSDTNGNLFAYALDRCGGGTQLDLDSISNKQPSDGLLWIHLDSTASTAQNWIHENTNMDPIIIEALTAEETRPRSLLHKDGMLIILRGVNLNPGKDPEDMISVRIWIDAHQIITLQRQYILAIDDLRQTLETGTGPLSPGGFLEDLTDRLVSRMGSVISDVDDDADALENEVLCKQTYELRQKIADIRRTAISMRRHLAPQRDVMARIHSEKVAWLNEIERLRLREIADRTTRYVEDLDAIRDRATVTQEELNGRLSEQMNKTMYMLSIVAGIFMPLGLLTGLLGINVGGIPGTNNDRAFPICCVLLLLIASAQIVFFKRKKWL